MNGFTQKKRDGLLRRSLPQALEMLAVVMQAGLDLQVAIAYVIEFAPPGPLREELRRVQLDMRAGSSRVEAMRAWGARARVEEVRETARALVQGLELGASLSPVLRIQARGLRKRLALEAEKSASLVPIKLMIPLFVFIFPTIFVVLFGPVALMLMQGSVR